MKKVKKPSIKVKEVFEKCISNYRDQVLKNRLETISTTLETFEKDYNDKATKNELYKYPESDNINNIVTMDEMKNVYGKKFVKKGQPGRIYYDELKLSADHNICPLCDHRTVTTLDHILAKTKHPLFAVTPFNLVPACGDCNKIKDTYQPSSQDDTFLHPYYDDISNEEYLYAKVKQKNPVSLSFYIKTSSPKTTIEKRLENNFSVLELNILYSANAARRLATLQNKLTILLASGGTGKVKKHLKEEYDNEFQINKNSWETAMFRALSENDWFINGGFSIS